MTRDKGKKEEKKLLSTGKLYVVFQEKMGLDRTLTLFSNHSPNALKMATPHQMLSQRAELP